ncbi:hypothetical protein NCAS_0I00770 [Naumovozyma castellii]|uniref:Increased recombination centers protein 22 n=1 Tax=Naumovozyma castellii TaxID=27288 RepID=G0VJR4_NAUCA|nr:hypothetical protein NCAS_0I00770 [Naumovozyma castellii CBS 4309]CCC71745.1 hypothetical protein NCAS_0I00770 [Naumovozyma castellii CBS 4309]
MKFINLACLSLLTASLTFAQEDSEQQQEHFDVDAAAEDQPLIQEPVATEEQEQESQGLPQINLNITYDILERLDEDRANILEFQNLDFATLNYTFTNYEDSNVTVTGVSGNILTMPNGQMAANVTLGEIGPVEVAINDTVVFQQQLQFELPDGQYYLVPIVHLTKEDRDLRVTAPPSFIEIMEPPMSFFNWQFLLTQFTILAVCAAGGYYTFVVRPQAFANDKKRVDKKKLKELDAQRPRDEDKSEWLPKEYKAKA